MLAAGKSRVPPATSSSGWPSGPNSASAQRSRGKKLVSQIISALSWVSACTIKPPQPSLAICRRKARSRSSNSSSGRMS